MSKRKAPNPRRRSQDTNQLDFDSLLGSLDPQLNLIPLPDAPQAVPGALDFDQRMRALLKQAMAACPLDVDQIAEGVSALIGRPVSKANIYSWTGQSRPHRFPAELIPAFNAVLGNTILLQGLADASGCRLSEPQELQFARLGQLYLIIHHAQGEQAKTLQALPLQRGRYG